MVLYWKQFDLNCQVGMWFGTPVFPFSVPLSHGAVGGVSSPQPGLEAKISFEDHCQGRREMGSPVFLSQTFVVAGSPYLMGMLTLKPD